MLAVLVSGAQAATPDPIVGFWKGQPPIQGPYPVIQVQGPGRDGLYFGLTMGGIGFGRCTHPGGQQIWVITKTGGGYTGTHWGFANTDTCAINPPWLEPAVWIVNGDRLEMRAGDHGGTVGACGSGGTECYTFVRVSGPSAPTAKDTTSPIVTALPSAGKRGTTIRLRYRVSDNSGVTREAVAIYRGKTLLKRWASLKYGEAKGKVYFVNFPPPAGFAGSYRFCVQSQDRAGNLSKISCASLKIA